MNARTLGAKKRGSLDSISRVLVFVWSQGLVGNPLNGIASTGDGFGVYLAVQGSWASSCQVGRVCFRVSRSRSEWLKSRRTHPGLRKLFDLRNRGWKVDAIYLRILFQRRHTVPKDPHILPL